MRLEIDGITKFFGRTVALNRVSFTLDGGGIHGFVGPNGKPVPLSDEEIARFGVEKRTVEVRYKVGDTVMITDGPLANFTGVVQEIDTDNNKVRVLTSMFGRETPVDLELNQVRVMED